MCPGQYHDAILPVGKKYAKKWLNKIGEEQFRRLLKLKEADNKAQNMKCSNERIRELRERELLIDEVLKGQECFSLKGLAVKGQDLINIGYKPGRELGVALRILLDYVIAERVENNKVELIRLANKWLFKLNGAGYNFGTWQGWAGYSCVIVAFLSGVFLSSYKK